MSGTSLKVKLFETSGTKVIPVLKSNLTVGRAQHCDIVLDHESVQEEHLRAWFDGGRVWIQDMGSQFGTFLNGIRLPSLKPMLVRELDVLKLGSYASTLGLEANVVRAPVVRQAAPSEEVTSPGRAVGPLVKDTELEKKRDELAKIRREVAELKFQLQMGRLDKTSEDEAHRQLSLMRHELSGLQDQKSRLDRNIKQMEQQRQSQLAAVEKEISERKTSAMNQLKNLMDHEMSKLADWKMQVMGDIRRDIHSLSQNKAKLWITRPLSQDMILEWESELQALLRKALLGEKIEADSAPVPTPPVPVEAPKPSRKAKKAPVEENSQSSFKMNTSSNVSEMTGTSISQAYSTASRPKRRLKKTGDGIKFFLTVVFVGGLVAAAIAFKRGFSPLKDRTLVGTLEATGNSIMTIAPARSTASPQKKKYEPVQTKGFKKNYTDNVLYTADFLESELDSKIRNQWLIDLNKTAMSEWKFDLTTAKSIADKEFQLVQDLKRLRDSIDGANEQPGIQAMRERESTFQRELETLTRGKVDKFNKLKKSFYARRQKP